MSIDGRSIGEWHHSLANKASAAPIDDGRGAYSIAEWVRRYGLSISMYHKLQKQGLGPRIMRIGTRTLVSVESDEQWRREREAASLNP